MEYLAILILVASSIFLVASSMFSRPRRYLSLEATPQAEKKSSALGFESLRSILKPLNFLVTPLVGKFTYLKKLKEQTETLKIKMDLLMLVSDKLILGILLGVLTFSFFSNVSPFFAPIAAAVGFFLPDYIVWQRVRSKKREIIRYFPESVDLLHMCINAGADLISAMTWVIEKSTPNPFIEQLSVVLSEIKIGKSRADALKDMAARLKLSDIASFSRLIVQAERMGTSIEEAFKNLSDDTRNRRFQAGERFAIKASLKILFPLIFCILPAIMIIVAGPIIIKFTQGELVPTTHF